MDVLIANIILTEEQYSVNNSLAVEVASTWLRNYQQITRPIAQAVCSVLEVAPAARIGKMHEYYKDMCYLAPHALHSINGFILLITLILDAEQPYSLSFVKVLSFLLRDEKKRWMLKRDQIARLFSPFSIFSTIPFPYSSNVMDYARQMEDARKSASYSLHQSTTPSTSPPAQADVSHPSPTPNQPSKPTISLTDPEKVLLPQYTHWLREIRNASSAIVFLMNSAATMLILQSDPLFFPSLFSILKHSHPTAVPVRTHIFSLLFCILRIPSTFITNCTASFAPLTPLIIRMQNHTATCDVPFQESDIPGHPQYDPNRFLNPPRPRKHSPTDDSPSMAMFMPTDLTTEPISQSILNHISSDYQFDTITQIPMSFALTTNSIGLGDSIVPYAGQPYHRIPSHDTRGARSLAGLPSLEFSPAAQMMSYAHSHNLSYNGQTIQTASYYPPDLNYTPAETLQQGLSLSSYSVALSQQDNESFLAERITGTPQRSPPPGNQAKSKSVMFHPLADQSLTFCVDSSRDVLNPCWFRESSNQPMKHGTMTYRLGVTHNLVSMPFFEQFANTTVFRQVIDNIEKKTNSKSLPLYQTDFSYLLLPHLAFILQIWLKKTSFVDAILVNAASDDTISSDFAIAMIGVLIDLSDVLMSQKFSFMFHSLCDVLEQQTRFQPYTKHPEFPINTNHSIERPLSIHQFHPFTSKHHRYPYLPSPLPNIHISRQLRKAHNPTLSQFLSLSSFSPSLCSTRILSKLKYYRNVSCAPSAQNNQQSPTDEVTCSSLSASKFSAIGQPLPLRLKSQRANSHQQAIRQSIEDKKLDYDQVIKKIQDSIVGLGRTRTIPISPFEIHTQVDQLGVKPLRTKPDGSVVPLQGLIPTSIPGSPQLGLSPFTSPFSSFTTYSIQSSSSSHAQTSQIPSRPFTHHSKPQPSPLQVNVTRSELTKQPHQTKDNSPGKDFYPIPSPTISHRILPSVDGMTKMYEYEDMKKDYDGESETDADFDATGRREQRSRSPNVTRISLNQGAGALNSILRAANERAMDERIPGDQDHRDTGLRGDTMESYVSNADDIQTNNETGEITQSMRSPSIGSYPTDSLSQIDENRQPTHDWNRLAFKSEVPVDSVVPPITDILTKPDILSQLVIKSLPLLHSGPAWPSPLHCHICLQDSDIHTKLPMPRLSDLREEGLDKAKTYGVDSQFMIALYSISRFPWECHCPHCDSDICKLEDLLHPAKFSAHSLNTFSSDVIINHYRSYVQRDLLSFEELWSTLRRLSYDKQDPYVIKEMFVLGSQNADLAAMFHLHQYPAHFLPLLDSSIQPTHSSTLQHQTVIDEDEIFLDIGEETDKRRVPSLFHLRWKEQNLIWADVGKHLITFLLLSPNEKVRQMAENTIRQIMSVLLSELQNEYERKQYRRKRNAIVATSKMKDAPQHIPMIESSPSITPQSNPQTEPEIQRDTQAFGPFIETSINQDSPQAEFDQPLQNSMLFSALPAGLTETAAPASQPQSQPDTPPKVSSTVSNPPTQDAGSTQTPIYYEQTPLERDRYIIPSEPPRLNHSYFSPRNIRNTMTQSVIQILGSLTFTEEGTKLFEEYFNVSSSITAENVLFQHILAHAPAPATTHSTSAQQTTFKRFSKPSRTRLIIYLQQRQDIFIILLSSLCYFRKASQQLLELASLLQSFRMGLTVLRILRAQFSACPYSPTTLDSTVYCMASQYELTKEIIIDWRIPPLVNLLSHPSHAIANCALSMLHSLSESPLLMSSFLLIRPSVVTLEGSSDVFLFRLLALPGGFEYLSPTTWFASRASYWSTSGLLVNLLRTEYRRDEVSVEKLVRYFEFLKVPTDTLMRGSPIPLVEIINVSTLTSIQKQMHKVEDKLLYFEESICLHSVIPQNFLHALANTIEGALYLKSTGLFEEYLALVASTKTHPILKRAIVWAIAHIVSAKEGSLFVERNGAVPLLCTIAEESMHLPLKATALLAISFILSSQTCSSTVQIMFSRHLHNEWMAEHDLQLQQVLASSNPLLNRNQALLLQSVQGQSQSSIDPRLPNVSEDTSDTGSNRVAFKLIHRLENQFSSWELPKVIGNGIALPKTFTSILFCDAQIPPDCEEVWSDFDTTILPQVPKEAIIRTFDLIYPFTRPNAQMIIQRPIFEQVFTAVRMYYVFSMVFASYPFPLDVKRFILKKFSALKWRLDDLDWIDENQSTIIKYLKRIKPEFGQFAFVLAHIQTKKVKPHTALEQKHVEGDSSL
ncbi:hypothetical protein BLNAU_7032 [Blattamonas nauphoetae]|uniref:Uncharacterized protein n=1 Tax=Blattamonas nauphoetae TaxID=2049346 RepID=A0ABQ9Y2Z2_9EUKA|nr:hypothetical protein BLNAU_7032 [Blattamonas nauphoetae]